MLVAVCKSPSDDALLQALELHCFSSRSWIALNCIVFQIRAENSMRHTTTHKYPQNNQTNIELNRLQCRQHQSHCFGRPAVSPSSEGRSLWSGGTMGQPGCLHTTWDFKIITFRLSIACWSWFIVLQFTIVQYYMLCYISWDSSASLLR